MTSTSQARMMLARQKRLLWCWMHSPLAKFDPDSPYGDPLGGSGEIAGSGVVIRDDGIVVTSSALVPPGDDPLAADNTEAEPDY